MTQGDSQEAEDFLRAHPEIESFHAFLTDPSGVQRGKVLRPIELVRAYKDGRPLPGSILGLDITGADVEETGLVWEDGDADRLCWPVPGSLTLMPWANRPAAQFILTSHELSGAASPGDPRHVLKRVVDALAADGYTAVAAVELEFYLLDQASAIAGRPQAPIASNGTQPKQLQAYLMQDLEDFSPFLDAVYQGGATMGLPLRTLISEYAPGQLEIVLQHQADALKAVDQAILYKRLVKGTADRMGYLATFMAKPFSHLSGSGTHLHVSLQDRDGRNVFAADDPTGSPLLHHAIAGLKATMAESMGIFAPNANSFRRFRRNSYAPVAPTWGVNNRSVSLRIPAGDPETRHVEHRVCGADANPYLALATVLAGLHKGIREKLDPGPKVEGNGYAQEQDKALPSNWYEALAALRRSTFLKDALGERFMDIYCAIKEGELDRFMAQVTELDYAWYLRLA